MDGLTEFNVEGLEFKFMAGFELYTVYPPGSYYFRVTGSAGEPTIVREVIIVVDLVDLCTTDFTVELLPSPFVDMTYALGD